MIFAVRAVTESGVHVESFEVPAPDFMVPMDQLFCLWEDGHYSKWSIDNRLDDCLHLEIRFGIYKVAITKMQE